jgi:6,7-dimethyl-8-ribityllumazine synthase
MLTGKIVIACARFNPEVTQKLLQGAKEALAASGISSNTIMVLECPGAVELPILLKNALLREDVMGGIALGCVIQGETKHFDYVAGECSRGLMQVMLELNKPITFGVLTTMDEAQAHARAGEGATNKGYECAEVLLEMLETIQQVRA